MRGHLRRRGNAWELRAYVGRDSVTGQTRYRTRTFRGGKREAEAALSHFVDEVGESGVAPSDATVGTLLNSWLSLINEDLSPTTVRNYQLAINNYLVPHIGNVRLTKLQTAAIDRLYRELRVHGGKDGKPLSPASVHHAHSVLRKALQQALRWGWLKSNPAALATPPKKRTPQLNPPNPTEVMALIESARNANPMFGAFLHVAATTGARRGELCALRWCDIDFDTAQLLISNAIIEGTRGELIEKDTKTHAARRIALDEYTVDVLQMVRTLAKDRASSVGGKLRSNSFVFSRSACGENPLPPNEASAMFRELREESGMRMVRLHDFRHFAATRLLAAGVPVRTVSGRLGHANAATTLGVYAHFIEASDRDAANKLGALISPLKD